MSTPKMKVIYSPSGEREVYTFANAYDLLRHAGYTAIKPKAETTADAEDVPADVESVNESESDANDMPDFVAMSKDKLEDYAKEKFAVNLDKRKSQASLAAEVAKLYVEHTEDDAE